MESEVTGGAIEIAKSETFLFRAHGLLESLQAAVKHLFALITRMESRSIPRGPSDYESETPRGYNFNYGDRGPTREPSWQGYLAKIVALIIASGLGSLVWVLSAMNSRLSTIEANQTGGTRLIIQRLDEQEKHLEAHDKQLDEVNRELWPHKH
jgi:hypothetical protein